MSLLQHLLSQENQGKRYQNVIDCGSLGDKIIVLHSRYSNRAVGLVCF